MGARSHPILTAGLLCLLAAACAPSTPRENATSSGAGASTDPEALVFLFQKQRDPLEVKQAADDLAAFLSEAVGLPVRYQIPQQYSASVQALVSGTADLAYISAIPYLLARRDGGAQLLAVEERQDVAGQGRTDYDAVLVVRADSPLQDFDALIARPDTVRMSFTSTQSTSGYVMPYRQFVRAGVLEPRQDPREVFASVQFAGSYDAAVREVISGRADVAAVSHYVVEGESAANYLREEELAQVRVLARIPGVPTHLVCARKGLSQELKDRVTDALVRVSEEAPDLLGDVYGAKKLLPMRDEEHVAAAAEAVEFLGIEIRGLVQ